MYDMTKIEYEKYKKVIIEILENKQLDIKDNDIDQFVGKILDITYSIGGSFDKAVLEKIVVSFLQRCI